MKKKKGSRGFKVLRPKQASFGFLYVFSHPQRSDLKIGYTRNYPADRARQVAKTLGYVDKLDKPIPFKVEFVFAVRNCRVAEKKLHEALADCHVEREFFDCTVAEASILMRYNFTGRDEEQQDYIECKKMKKLLESDRRRCHYRYSAA